MKDTEINELFDLLFEAQINSTVQPAPGYYKLEAAKAARDELYAFETTYYLKKIFSIDGVKEFYFDFSEEYNDEGGTYLVVSGNMSYLYGGKKCLLMEFEEFDDKEFLDKLNKKDKKKFEENLSALLEHMNGISEGMHGRAEEFYSCKYTKENVSETYTKHFPEAASIISKHYLSKKVTTDNKISKGPNKI